MRINTIKFTIVVLLIVLMAGIMAGVFFVEMPEGNRDIANLALGSLLSSIIHSISDLFKKGANQ